MCSLDLAPGLGNEAPSKDQTHYLIVTGLQD